MHCISFSIGGRTLNYFDLLLRGFFILFYLTQVFKTGHYGVCMMYHIGPKPSSGREMGYGVMGWSRFFAAVLLFAPSR